MKTKQNTTKHSLSAKYHVVEELHTVDYQGAASRPSTHCRHNADSTSTPRQYKPFLSKDHCVEVDTMTRAAIRRMKGAARGSEPGTCSKKGQAVENPTCVADQHTQVVCRKGIYTAAPARTSTD